MQRLSQTMQYIRLGKRTTNFSNYLIIKNDLFYQTRLNNSKPHAKASNSTPTEIKATIMKSTTDTTTHNAKNYL